MRESVGVVALNHPLLNYGSKCKLLDTLMYYVFGHSMC